MNCPVCVKPASVLIRRNVLPSSLAVYRCRLCRLDFMEPASGAGYWDTPGQSDIYEDAAVLAERKRFFDSVLCKIASSLKPGRLLDVGAGKGEFALEAHRRGWQVSVVEPSQSATAGLADMGVAGIHNCAFEEFSPCEAYDCVTLLDFIEHTQNPAAAVEKAARCLNPGGLLVILTPDASALARRIALATARVSSRTCWLLKYFYYQPHVSYLGPEALLRLCRDNALEPVALERTSTPRRFLIHKLKTHYSKYPGNAVFAALLSAAYPVLRRVLANKLLLFCRKPAQ